MLPVGVALATGVAVPVTGMVAVGLGVAVVTAVAVIVAVAVIGGVAVIVLVGVDVSVGVVVAVPTCWAEMGNGWAVVVVGCVNDTNAVANTQHTASASANERRIPWDSFLGSDCGYWH